MSVCGHAISRRVPDSVEDREALAALLDESARQGRTWTAAALCDWLAAERGARVSAAWLTELLHRDGFRWKPTRDTSRHKADPVLQQAARAREDLRALRLDAHEGVRDLYVLDESGFAPTMPTGYTWSRVGQRAVVPREDKKGRRVNVLGVLAAPFEDTGHVRGSVVQDDGARPYPGEARGRLVQCGGPAG